MMKKIAVALAVASLAATASVALAGPQAGTGINGSWHDINAAAGYSGDSLGRTCVFCHTPHNAQTTESLVPLWNHADSTPPVMQPYAWVSPMNKGIGIVADPLVGPSRLCMACHDGSTAVDSHGTAASFPTGTTPMTAHYTDALGNNVKRFITDLTVTHPIGFLYADAVTARNNGQDKSEIQTTDHGYIKDASKINPATWDTTLNSAARTAAGETSKKIGDTLYGGYMTCATCHDVHNSVNAAPVAGSGHSYNYFLYAQEEGSAICLSCHAK